MQIMKVIDYLLHHLHVNIQYRWIVSLTCTNYMYILLSSQLGMYRIYILHVHIMYMYITAYLNYTSVRHNWHATD